MLRTQVVRLARVNNIRQFSAVAARAAAGDTGGTRPGGSASSDSFNKREQASENLFIRQKELESLKRLKEKMKDQRKHLDELDKHIEDLENSRNGQ